MVRAPEFRTDPTIQPQCMPAEAGRKARTQTPSRNRDRVAAWPDGTIGERGINMIDRTEWKIRTLYSYEEKLIRR